MRRRENTTLEASVEHFVREFADQIGSTISIAECSGQEKIHLHLSCPTQIENQAIALQKCFAQNRVQNACGPIVKIAEGVIHVTTYRGHSPEILTPSLEMSGVMFNYLEKTPQEFLEPLMTSVTLTSYKDIWMALWFTLSHLEAQIIKENESSLEAIFESSRLAQQIKHNDEMKDKSKQEIAYFIMIQALHNPLMLNIYFELLNIHLANSGCHVCPSKIHRDVAFTLNPTLFGINHSPNGFQFDLSGQLLTQEGLAEIKSARDNLDPNKLSVCPGMNKPSWLKASKTAQTLFKSMRQCADETVLDNIIKVKGTTIEFSEHPYLTKME